MRTRISGLALKPAVAVRLCRALLLCITIAALKLHANELEPRSYINFPIKQNVLVASYVYSSGDVSFAPSVALENAHVRFQGVLTGFAHTFSLNNKSAKFDMSLPYVCTDGRAELNGEPSERSVCGFADARLRLAYNFYGAPAYTLAEFRKHPRQIVAGASLQLSLPNGDYDEDKLLNIGANRWFIRPELGLSIPWQQQWSFEFSLGVKYFTDNTEFVGDVTLSQDPLYNFQTHIAYDITPGKWLALDMNYFWGGDTQKDAVESFDQQKNSRIGLTYSQALNRRYLIKCFVTRGVITRIGNDSTTAGIALLYGF